MDPENGGFPEKEMPFGKHHFQVPAGKFSGVYTKPSKRIRSFTNRLDALRDSPFSVIGC